MQHQSVLLEQAVVALVTDKNGFYVDGTFGRGGHSRRILKDLSEQGRLLVIDKDPEAIALAQELALEDKRVSVYHGSFDALQKVMHDLDVMGQVTGVLLDLGVSSPQLDDAQRGFSFNKDGPLDMRMNTASGTTAEAWLAQVDEKALADVLYQFGEERYSRRIARAICKYRLQDAISSTLQLAEIIKQAHPKWERHKHPATRSFQAIRIVINNELGDLQNALAVMLDALAIGGRLVVISFHSLEDRIVKQFIQKEIKGGDFPVDLPITQDQLNPRLKAIGKAVKAGDEEVNENIRSRSAIMRIAEKIA
ncbi:MAG: 16S rRNA (cytosine(1402)-N(4))-methyltransferase [SAR86 cluster bacterium]|uniref:Ribosomal RNA small subunit methyltransferase H n=1 Tax=SAR86 cluster bacterium TaxID=2030880 RepID=A0A2A5CAX5_9GAMM|nr:MAG: 16S rRNA (cytosine(1402)-N(4))-methyltransferase [SAR86 cluster bacterium]